MEKKEMKKEFTKTIVISFTEAFLPMIFWFGLLGILALSYFTATLNGVMPFSLTKFLDELINNNLFLFVAIVYVMYSVKDIRNSLENTKKIKEAEAKKNIRKLTPEEIEEFASSLK